MASEYPFRQYMALEAQGELAEAYATHARAQTDAHRQTIHTLAERHLKTGIERLRLGENVTPSIVAHPSLDWRLVLEGRSRRSAPLPEHIWSVRFTCSGTRDDALGQLHTIREGLDATLPDASKLTTAADLPVFTAEFWNPANATAPLFGDREAARKLMGVADMQRVIDTEQVNVVVVDQGIDEELVKRLGGKFGGGWENVPAVKAGLIKRPGKTKGGHGAMMVRNILDVAPGITVFDCSLLPTHIANIKAFLSHAHAAYARMIADIRRLRERDERWRGPWIFVNAWAIFDRASEHPLGDYTNNAKHPFNVLMGEAADTGFDLVFCAGNCGQFCPVMRCGVHDRGPGHSIYGANSHPRVLTAGAVRVDSLWLGYSSQGPGQPNLAHQKPDLCAPSQFAEARDAFTSNTGSSAASALAAGAVAVLRGRWGNAFSPDELKDILVTSARKIAGPNWNGSLGHGILNLAAAFEEARRREAG